MNEPTVVVMYSCHPCGLKDREVTVRERGSEEDIIAWVNHVAVKMAEDHSKLKPRCRINSLSEMKIPLPAGSSVLGRVPRQ